MNSTTVANGGKPTLLIALGGNALIKKGQTGTSREQFENLKIPISQIARLSKDYNIIITHGNGPQVGNLLLQQEACDDVPKMPLEILVAQTQGQIGYMIESTLDKALMDEGIDFRPLISLITYVVVDENDPSFQNPTKPIGPGYTKEQAQALDYPTMETSKGCRRVVASPRPQTIIEKREIEHLLRMNFIVVCCGGGGIPVIRNGRAFNGVDAVIDKDLASSLLAQEVGIELMVIATDIEGVMADFGTPEQHLIPRMNTTETRQFLDNEATGKGSMRPKVEASTLFVEKTGKRAVITSITKIVEGVNGTAGTQIVPA